MIDIFGDGPYLKLDELIFGSLNEWGIYFLHFFFFLAVILLFKRVASRRMVTVAVLLLPALQIAYVWSVSIKSEFLYSFCLAFLITMQIRILNLLPLKALDYSFLFSAMLFPNRLFNTTSSFLGSLWFFWVLFCVIYTTAKIGIHKLKGYHFACYFLFMFLSFSMHLYFLTVQFLYPTLRRLTGNSALSIISILFTTLILLFALTFFVNAKYHSQLIQLNHFGKKHKTIERYFFGFSFLILLLFTLIFLPFSILQLHNAGIVLLIPCLCLVLLCIQMPFILLLYRVAFYKDSATFYEWEREKTASYYKELSESLTAMQEMRHDIKNIFFTMGNFVERSDDLEMKRFFWEKIYPYSVETIQQNELFSRLYQLPVESLRAFFHLKVSQALNQKIKTSMEVHVIPETFQTGMDIIDLTRVLGILLDNAIEETAPIPSGSIEIKITANETGCSYIIKNTITEQTREQGIYMGKTSKGPGHGKGLLIVQQLLEQYHHVALNSTMQQLTYIQSLNITFMND